MLFCFTFCLEPSKSCKPPAVLQSRAPSPSPKGDGDGARLRKTAGRALISDLIHAQKRGRKFLKNKNFLPLHSFKFFRHFTCRQLLEKNKNKPCKDFSMPVGIVEAFAKPAGKRRLPAEFVKMRNIA